MTYIETACVHLVRVARDIPKSAPLEVVNKELLARFPFEERRGSLYNAWRRAIRFHLREREKLAAWEGRQ